MLDVIISDPKNPERTLQRQRATNEKILYSASTTSHLHNFHLPYIKWLNENGYMVTTLTDDGQFLPNTYQSLKASFTKSLLDLKNIKAVFETKNLIINSGCEAIITNTTLAGTVVRLAVALIPKHKRPKTIHISHGFWYNHGGALERFVSLAVEKICAHVTDVFVTMNSECIEIAWKRKFGKTVKFVHGMGVDILKFQEPPIEHSGYKFVYAADFSPRKNQQELIRAFAGVADELPGASLILAGEGSTIDECKNLAAYLGIVGKVDFLGYVTEIPKLLAGCDCAVSTSKYEGMPFNIMEAMAAGMPIIASRIAGHTDLLDGTDGAILYEDEFGLREALKTQYALAKRGVVYERLPQYTLDAVKEEWQGILSGVLN